ncbi:MAG: hypothetical protein GC201_00135 [Alphaproteobacteria bacterium]|nr:hypothetical protein [Alphaproteobacteria bacterium]
MFSVRRNIFLPLYRTERRARPKCSTALDLPQLGDVECRCLGQVDAVADRKTRRRTTVIKLESRCGCKPTVAHFKLTHYPGTAALDGSKSGPIPAIHGVVRWRLIDLVQWLHDEFAVSLDETTVGRELKKLGYVKLTARPRHHARNELAMEAFKKGASPPSWQRSEQPSRRGRP